MTFITTGSTLLAHLAAQNSLHELVDLINRNPGRSVSGSMSDGPVADRFALWDDQCKESLDLIGVTTFLAYLRSHNAPEPSSVEFETLPFDGAIPPKEPGETEIRGRAKPMISVMTSLSCYLVGGAYERVSDRIKTKFGPDPVQWPPELQFFRHLRNASFHGNQFDIRPYKGQPQIDPNNPPLWHTYTMPSDSKMNGTQAMDGFFRIPHVLPLLHDLSKLL